MTNGERHLLLQLRNSDIRVLFDVGANVGNWSKMAAVVFPAAQIHCFEISAATFAVLSERLGNKAGCVLNNIGLSQTVGEVMFNDCATHSELTSIEPVLWHPTTRTKGRVTTGAAYASERGVDHIDFLKIDTENHDFFVLKGFDDLFRAGKVRFIQFEYGRGSIDTKKLLKDYYDLLQGHGFVVGKVYPRYIDFRNYSYDSWDEDFTGPNYLAVKKSEVVALRKMSATE
jgi:FkbM family methyltransferase